MIEAIGDSPAATRELWRYLLGIDWMDEIHCELLSVDHPLFLLVAAAEPPALAGRRRPLGAARRRRRGAVGSRRSRATAASRSRSSSDPVFPDNVGTWTVEDGVARRSRRRADVRLDVQALASAYLGGFTFAELARAGRVEEVARGGIARADALYRVDAKPWCPEIF